MCERERESQKLLEILVEKEIVREDARVTVNFEKLKKNQLRFCGPTGGW